MIKRNINKVPKPGKLSPAAHLVIDMLEHHGMSQSEAAKVMKISPQALNYIIKGKRSVTADFALRFEIAFGVRAQLMLNLQADHDYYVAYHSEHKLLRKEIRAVATS